MNTLQNPEYLPVLRGQEILAPLYSRWHPSVHFCGGYVRWMVSPSQDPAPPGDIDIFPKSHEAYADVVKGLTDWGFKRAFESTVALSMTAPQSWGVDYPKVQVIVPEDRGALRVSGSLLEVLGNFDFTVVRAGLVSRSWAAVDPDFLADEMAKRLRIKNIHCPIGSTLRLAKYVKKGYRAHAADVLLLFVDWDNRDEAYKEDLRTGLPRLTLEGEDALTEDEREHLTSLIYID